MGRFDGKERNGPAGPGTKRGTKKAKPGGSRRSDRRYPRGGRRSRGGPGQSSGPEVAAIRGELAQLFPWLRRLANGREILELYAERVAWTRESDSAARGRDALPDPGGTIVSREKDARAQAREPWQTRASRAHQELSVLGNRTGIDMTELLSDDFLTADNDRERAGREAMVAQIQRGQGFIELRMPGGAPEITVTIDGAWLPVHRGAIAFEAFFQRSEVALLAIQKTYHDAVATCGRGQLKGHVDRHPWIAGAAIDDMIAEQRRWETAALLGEESPELAEMRQLDGGRRELAESMRGQVVAAMAPLVVIAGLFAIEGAFDVFLALFPAGKAADLVRGIRLAGKSRRGKRLLGQLGEALSQDQAQFIRLASGLSRAELEAVQRIAGHIHKPDLVNLLLAGRAVRRGDLTWIAGMLDQGVFDRDFVAGFLRYDANPTWKSLQDLIEGKLDRRARDSIMSKMTGFMGEEAAARQVKKPAFARRFFNRPGDLAVSRGEKSLDLVVRSEKDQSALLFGETKNWSIKTWQDSSKRAQAIEQLERHNGRIGEIVGKTDNRRVAGKLLLVAERGYMALNEPARDEFKDEIARLGWSIEIIPDSAIESAGEFLDRFRKGD